jgi:uncharacterized protein (UPF0210 family)
MMNENLKNKQLCKIRTITTFLVLNSNKSLWEDELLNACTFCEDLSEKFFEENYDVQSIRIVTNAFGEYLDTSSLNSAKKDLSLISNILNKSTTSLRIRFAIGEAKTYQEVALLPELILCFGDLANACVNISLDENEVLDNELIVESVKAVKKISEITPRGEGNFNFTVNFNCKPFIPYFPASYHEKELGNAYVLGLETPDLLVEVLKDFNAKNPNLSHNVAMASYSAILKEALSYHCGNIKNILDGFENNSSFVFKGIDSSAAPSKNCSSMVEVYKQMGLSCFGRSGTVEISSLLTKVFKSVKELPLVGFSGLMLAVVEDRGLAQGTIDKDFDIRTLLTNSAICGIGLDTVPIEGDTPNKKIEEIMRDTGTMAYRLNKPLTVRLFPVPNLKEGDLTTFQSDDLCNSVVLALP